MNIALRQNSNDNSKVLSTGSKTEDNLQKELNDLIKNISTEVIDSTVNQSIQDASYVIQKQVPEIDKVVTKLRTESNEIQKVKNELQTLKHDLRSLMNEFDENSKQHNLDEQIMKLEKEFDRAVSLLETETKNTNKKLSSLINDNNQLTIERIDKLEHILMLQAIKQEEKIQLKVDETVRKWSILLLIGIAVLTIIF